jgi:hypothetical protein
MWTAQPLEVDSPPKRGKRWGPESGPLSVSPWRRSCAIISPVELLYFVFVVFGGAGALVGLALAALFGGSGFRALALIMLGIVVVGGALVAHANTHELADCHDCSEFAGGAIHPLEVVGAAANMLTWGLAVIVVSLLKRARRGPDGLISSSFR